MQSHSTSRVVKTKNGAKHGSKHGGRGLHGSGETMVRVRGEEGLTAVNCPPPPGQLCVLEACLRKATSSAVLNTDLREQLLIDHEVEWRWVLHTAAGSAE